MDGDFSDNLESYLKNNPKYAKGEDKKMLSIVLQPLMMLMTLITGVWFTKFGINLEIIVQNGA